MFNIKNQDGKLVVQTHDGTFVALPEDLNFLPDALIEFEKTGNTQTIQSAFDKAKNLHPEFNMDDSSSEPDKNSLVTKLEV